jgi:transposase
MYGWPAGWEALERRGMETEKSATVFCFTPKRVTLEELERLRAEDGAGRASRVPLPACSAPTLPEGPCPVCPRLAEEFEPWRQAGYWKSRHQRAVEREKLLKEEVARLQAPLRLRAQQLFGRKSETHAASSEALTPPKPTPKKSRGQQPGWPGPPRRDYSHLPAVEEILDVSDEQQRCSCCGLPLEPFPGTEDSEVLEIEVKAYRRVIRRRRSRRACGGAEQPGLVTAAPAGKGTPKSILGVSIWVEVLLDQFLFYRPPYRLLAEWQTRGLDWSLGTLTDGLRRLLPLFEPVYEKLSEHNQKHKHWHADETRWLVFATGEGKVGYRWFLWVFHSAPAVGFVLSSGRAHDVPEEPLGPVKEGILSVERYAAYKARKQVKEGLILLAFCWAHVRRDFLEAARSWPAEEEWALGWVARIGQLYKDNEARLEVSDSKSAAFAEKDGQLRQHVEQMAEQTRQELADPNLHPARKSVLTSWQEHGEGLKVFVEHPEVPMDNNTAERVQRGPVVLRKNSYGSGAVWAGELAAMLFSVFQTLCLGNINPRVWLTEYLQACAAAGGQAPNELAAFLPWQMAEEKRKEWSLENEKEREDSS